MAGFQPLRRRVDLFFDDTTPTDDWMAQRNAWVAARDEAEAAGRDVWNEATKAGRDTRARTPDDLIQLGAQSPRSAAPLQLTNEELIQPVEPDGPLRKAPAIGFATAIPGGSISRSVGDPARQARSYATGPAHIAEQRPSRTKVLEAPSGPRVNDATLPAKLLAAGEGWVRGLGPGAVKGLEDLSSATQSTMVLGFRMENPVLDRVFSPPGETASDELARGALRFAPMAIHAAAHPQAALRQANAGLNPLAISPKATAEEARRQGEHVGKNHGELAINALPFVLGGPAAEAAETMALAREATTAEGYMARGWPEAAATYLAEPYPETGMGAHWFARSTRLPKLLGGGPLPSWLVDSPLNVWKPPGITRAQWAEHHYRNDLDFHGGPIAGRKGKGTGYSGKKLGWSRNSPFARRVEGMPPVTKGILLGGVAGTSNAGYQVSRAGGQSQ